MSSVRLPVKGAALRKSCQLVAPKLALDASRCRAPCPLHKAQLNQRRSTLAAAAAASARPAVFMFGFGGDDDLYEEEECTVLKLQIGIFGDTSKWQKKFVRMAEQYDTEETEGLHGILQETLQLLLRNNEYCQYALSAGRVYDNFDDAEVKFNEVSFTERSKCKEETLSNVDGRKKSEAEAMGSDSGDLKDKDQWMCITLVMAVARELKLPPISTVYDLQKALKVLGGILVDDLMAFELMWTPQQEGDSYSRDELLLDFPTLITLI
eukprot:CAMPEP_0202343022 /NCGR_PEP_ID=MMETSP1126-20121109/3329_1 /ASSEMBLY_ACC=CAM_ASM_000457 /TAXON_ID=3047 /ORGANISM="Dunaliella tertiolecta, Strain CCMP1320" /LENGTH=265 /DNA_ID=CAMNT_0048934047 /DNA_START=2492 /DNA_END=3289 /DNA_ORIENTATION=+